LGICDGSLHWRGTGHLPTDEITLLNDVNTNCVLAALDEPYAREADMPERIATSLKTDDSAFLRCIVDDVAEFMRRMG